MSAKISAARRSAFLKALEETGNQTLAAERAKVSRSWVCLHRSERPDFGEACKAAIAKAKARLAQATERKPPSGWGFLDGAELVVRGTGGSALRDAAGAAPQDERKKGRRVQIARARLRQWTPRVEERFLATLAATCNVKAACAEVGMWPPSAYAHRKRWPAFARRWDDAIDIGYTRIEAALLEHGGNLFSGDEIKLEGAVASMDFWQAVHLLNMHKHQVHGIGKRPGLMERRRKDEEVLANIMRKLKAIRRGIELGEEDRARAEREWGFRRRRSG